ncbi:hypothetical protein, partial [Bilophila wadsworthia]
MPEGTFQESYLSPRIEKRLFPLKSQTETVPRPVCTGCGTVSVWSVIPFHGWKETTFEFRGLSPNPVSGNAANRDSINVKIFEEKGVGFGEG